MIPRSLLSTYDALLKRIGVSVVDEDLKRPWGGFLVIDEADANTFQEHFFPDTEFSDGFKGAPRRPKILFVAPTSRLSWQYHERRAEIWRVLEGPVSVMKSVSNAQTEPLLCAVDEIIRLAQGERHRLIGENDWGVVAEIWQHTDPAHLSEEDDIIRLDDDYGR